ncbi:MAG: phytanoyl-CoA dioxygenase family protein, partial [Pseudomonadota bacterium]
LSSPFPYVRHFDATTIQSSTPFIKLKNQIETFIQKDTDYEVVFRKLWLVDTTPKDSDQTKLPYIPHFDKERYLKAMIYLTDVTHLDDGPIHLLNSEIDGLDTKRRSLPRNHKEKGLNHIQLEDDAEITPIVGNAGTMILFDTNTPHKAGTVAEGHRRKVLRFDFEDPSWNHRSLFRKIKDRLTEAIQP